MPILPSPLPVFFTVLCLWGLGPVVAFADDANTPPAASPTPQNPATPQHSTTPQHSAAGLNWLSRDDARLPDTVREQIPAWCSGTYYVPAASTTDTTRTTLTADRSRLNAAGLVELSGDVEIIQGSRRIQADSASVNQQTGDYTLTGGVRVDAPESTFIADTLSGNTRQRQGLFQQAQFALHQEALRGRALSINQAGDLILIEQGSYTACPPGGNSWLLEAADIELDTAEGWGVARHTVLRVKDVPVVYIPWMTFPIDDRRRSGLLFPAIGSADGGLDLSQPIYLNLHPQLDATVSPRHIHGRGSMIETEVRYLTRLGEGTLGGARLPNDRQFNDENRKLGSYRHQGLVDRWILNADMNYVSDDYYLKDLDTGLEVSAVSHLNRLAEARYQGQVWNGLIRAQAWQTIDPTIADTDLPWRRVPQLLVTGSPQLFNSPFRLHWHSEYVLFDRTADIAFDDINGQRLHLQPALSLPFTRSWGHLEPRIRHYSTHYALNGVDTLPDNYPERNVWGASLDTGLVFERVLGDTAALTQTLEPRLFYHRLPWRDQSALPDFGSAERTFSYTALFKENRFTGYDRIGDEEKISLGIVSRFINNDSGAEKLRVRVGQAFYLEDRKLQLNNALPDTDPVSPVAADISWFFNPHWRFYADTVWNSLRNEREQNSALLGYSQGRRLAHLGFRYRPVDQIRQADVGFIWPVSSHWSVIGRWLNDLDANRSVETLGGVEYRNCCVQVRLVSNRTLQEEGDGDTRLEADQITLLQIRLRGLGGIGDRVEKILERSISGYRRNDD